MKQKDEWSPCKACGDTRVDRDTAFSLTPGYEIVMVNCKSCGNRRGRYKRKKKENQ